MSPAAASISISSSINSAAERCTVTEENPSPPPRGVDLPASSGGTTGGGVKPELLPEPELKPDE